MSATTDTDLGDTQQGASVAPKGKANMARIRKIESNTRGATAGKVARGPKSTVPKGRADSKKAGSVISRTRAASKVGTTVRNVVNIAAHVNVAEGLGKSNGAKSSNGGGNAVKAHTEAGKKRLVNRLIGLAETQATEGGFKITPADLIRLMQLHKELNPQKDRKVTVQWVEDRPV